MTMRTNDNGTDRDMTEAEIADYKAWQKIAEAEAKAAKDADTAKDAAKQAVLDRLGITADEARMLLS